MAFPKRLLTEGEELVIDARPHWIALVGAVVVTVLIIAAEVLLLTRIHGHGTGSRILRWIVGGAGIVLFVIYPLRRFIHWATSHFVVTNQRIIHRQGWLAKTSMEVPLQRINDVRFRQGILDRMVGAGDLIIESAGTRGQEVFSDIRNPEAMQRTIYERAESREHPTAPPPAPPPPVAATTARPPRPPPRSWPGWPISATGGSSRRRSSRPRRPGCSPTVRSLRPMAPHEVPISMTFQLRDGTPVIVRPVFREDHDRLREGMHRLSEQSRYRRFGATLSELSDDQLRYLTEIDHENHMAWIALDPQAPGQPALGVARYVRLSEEPEVAEAAVVVADQMQGRGLGTILLSLLGVAALTNGIRVFRAYVLVENRLMLEILREMGGAVTLEEPGLYRVDLPLSEDPEDIPDTPTGRVFKAVAKRVLPPLEVLRRTMPGPGEPA